MSIGRLEDRFIIVLVLVMVSSVILRDMLVLKHLHSVVVVCNPNIFDVLVDNFHRI